MRLMIPPPIQLCFSVIIMWVLSKSIDQVNFDFNGINELALLFLICGFIIILLAVNQFRDAKTTIHPQIPYKTSFLVHKGIYKYTRNPMYLGLVLILVSVAFCLRNIVGFSIIPLFILFITKYQIIPEEEVLESIFGKEYLRYINKVRRWI